MSVVRRCLRAMALLLVPAVTGAQPLMTSSYVRDVVSTRDGMPDTQISAVAQTTDGYLWLGTRRGLVRYDGLAFTTYAPPAVEALPSTSVNALVAEPSGTLWISTDKGLVAREGTRFRRVDSSQVPAVVTWKSMRDRRGRLWVVGAFGARVGDGTRFRPIAGVTAHLYAIAEDASGRIWLAGRDYLASLDGPDAAPQVASFSGGERFFDVVEDGAGGVFAGTRHGVLRVRSVAGRPVVAERIATAAGREWAQVWALTRDAAGTLWMGTDTRGVLRLDGTQAVPADPDPDRRPDAVWALARDLRGRIWAGSSGGLLRFQRSPFHALYAGLGPRSTWSIRADRDGQIWATTDEGQGWRLAGGQWMPLFTNLANRTPGSTWPRRAGGVYFADDEGRVFIAQRSGVEEVSRQFAFPGDGPLGLFEDDDGSLWASTHSGLMRSTGDSAYAIYDSLGLTERDEPRVIMRDRRHRLLVGGPGITIMDAAGIRRLGAREGLTDPEVLAVHEDGDRLWVGTADSGLYVIRDDRAMLLSRLNARLRRDIHGIVRDDYGALWLTSSTGLLRANVADLEQAIAGRGSDVRVREFNRVDGLPSNDVNGDYQSVILKEADGGIWLPTAGGPVHFNPRDIADDALAPQVHLEQLLADGVAFDGTRVALKGHPARIDVTFAATNALNPERVRAAYRVIGVDSGWTDLGRRRTITFGPLNGGRYRVEIRVAAEDGDWNPAIAAADIIVPKAWFEHAWFYPALVALSALAAFLLFRLRLAAARERERELSLVVRDRTRELEAARASLEVRVEERTAALAHELTQRSALEQRLASARKMESLGRLAGGVSHEINNALATVLGFAQLARGSAKGNGALQADIDEVVRAGRRAANITQQLLAFARQQHTPMRALRLDTMVAGMVRELEQLLGRELTLRTRIADEIPAIMADPLQVEQLLVNLVRNARDASSRDGSVTIAVESRTLTTAQPIGDHLLAAGDYVTLAVIDHGHGIAAEALEHLFEPFYTTKDLSSGSGLGLAVCQGIVARHQGAIEVESTVGERTMFRAWFPALAAPIRTDEIPVERVGGSETILFVEDETAIRTFAVRMLEGDGYTVLAAADGDAALRLVTNTSQAIDCVVTDIKMPNVNGLELARLLRATRADLPIIFISGFAGLEEEALRELESIGPMLAKPFTREELAAAVRRVLDERRLQTANAGS